MYSNKRFRGAIIWLLVVAPLSDSVDADPSGQEPVTAAGKPAEAALDDF